MSLRKIMLCVLLYPLTTFTAVEVTIDADSSTEIMRPVSVTTQMHRGAGFFAEFNKVLTSLIYYEQDGIKSMHVDWSNQFFPFKDSPSENGWDLYFEPIQLPDPINEHEPVNKVGHAQAHELHDQKCLAPWLRYDDYAPFRTFAHEKIMKHIHIKQHIVDAVDLFYEQNMKDRVCIGVQVRYAKAHAHEAPGGHPSLDAYCKEIDALLETHHDAIIYLASDSNAVINHFKKRYANKLIYLDTHRAQHSEDPGLMYENPHYWTTHVAEWHKAKPGYKGGLGVLMDCLLLSRCDYFIHTTSNVATYVCFFNPAIKSTYLPRGLKFIPCRYKNNPHIRNKFLNPV